MMAPRYHIDLFWYEPDSCWIANVPDLRSCSAHGDTPEEALAELQIAMEGWLETARECDITIPEPQYRHTSLAA